MLIINFNFSLVNIVSFTVINYELQRSKNYITKSILHKIKVYNRKKQNLKQNNLKALNYYEKC